MAKRVQSPKTQTHAQPAANEPEYHFTGVKAHQVVFLLDLLSNIQAPMVVTRPIFDLLQGQMAAQDNQRKAAGKPAGPTASSPPKDPTPKPEQATTH